MTKHKKNAKSLRFEGLENRTLMAGDVTVAVVSGVLQITGDTADNAIQIKQSGADWRVQGLGTTVNGNNGAQTFTGVTGIAIELGAGNDLIKASKGTLTGSFVINDVGGQSTIDLSKLSANSIDISTFDARDTIILSKCAATTSFSVNSFSTADDEGDTISIGKSTAGTTFDVATGAGDDVVTIDGVTVVDTFVVNTFSPGESDLDLVKISKSSSGDALDVLTGDGRDFVTLNKVQVGADLQIIVFESTGDTNSDTVDIAKSSAAASVEISTGDGLDGVRLSKFTAGTDILISTSATVADVGDVVILANLSAGNDIVINTGDGTDSASLTKVVAVADLNVNLGEGDSDQLFVARSRALAALFDGGDNDDDLIAFNRNVFTTPNVVGFEHEIGL
jgi:hypothetical protein